MFEDDSLMYVTEENLAEYQKKYARKLLPTADVTFKLLMGDKNHTNLLIHLLNSIPISPDPIVSVTIENVERPDANTFLKFYRLDILAITDKNEIIIVEMATSEEDGWAVPKFVQYLARVFATQLKKGQSYKKLKKTIGILIADCRLGVFKNDEFYWRRVRLNDERTGANFTPLLEAYIVELPKMKQLDKNHPLTYWIEFLRNPYSAATQEICRKVPEIEEAMKMYEKIKSDPSTIDHLIRMEMAEQEHDESIREAEERGEEKGREKGREEGAHSKAIEIAKNLLRAGVASTIVSTSSGLSLNEVQALR